MKCLTGCKKLIAANNAKALYHSQSVWVTKSIHSGFLQSAMPRNTVSSAQMEHGSGEEPGEDYKQQVPEIQALPGK